MEASQSIVGSKFLNPDYLFGKGFAAVRAIYNFLGNFDFQNIGHIFNVLLFIFGCFFVAIIFYSSIRVLEIRRKEHHHLQEEIKEYAHHHPDLV